jgi:hypothetical protein
MSRQFGLLICLGTLLITGCSLNFSSFTGVQGSGVLATETRDVGDFTGLDLRGSANVKIAVGQKARVVLELDDNLLPLIQTEVRNGQLVIDNQQSYRSSRGLSVSITVPELQQLAVHGAGDISIVNLDSDQFDVDLNGSSDVTALGSARKLTVTINGSGTVHLEDVVANEATATIRGSGDIRLHALEELSANILGSGDIRYRGTPQVSKSIQGSGSIEPLAEPAATEPVSAEKE